MQSLRRAFLQNLSWTPRDGALIRGPPPRSHPVCHPLPLACVTCVSCSSLLGDAPRFCTVCLPHSLTHLQLFLSLLWRQLSVMSLPCLHLGLLLSARIDSLGWLLSMALVEFHHPGSWGQGLGSPHYVSSAHGIVIQHWLYDRITQKVWFRLSVVGQAWKLLVPLMFADWPTEQMKEWMNSLRHRARDSASPPAALEM